MASNFDKRKLWRSPSGVLGETSSDVTEDLQLIVFHSSPVRSILSMCSLHDAVVQRCSQCDIDA